jgi:hypothetical protein|tara:strand:- start:1030 stop:1587 length:558 start_codon:yes stop_codon:yes gene_type:complete
MFSNNMGLFGKKKEEPTMPKPTAPFVPSQPAQGASLRDQLNINQPAEQPAPQGLPPLPEDISANVEDVSKKVTAMTERVSDLESGLPPLPEDNAPVEPEPQTLPAQTTPQNTGAKVFVRLDKYSDILKTINTMEAKINELQNALGKISTIKQSEQQVIESWNALISEARDKVSEVNSKLPPLNRQ